MTDWIVIIQQYDTARDQPRVQRKKHRLPRESVYLI